MILITGAAGFIGFYVAQRLIAEGCEVHGVDNLNDYYDPSLKEERLAILSRNPAFTFHRIDIASEAAVLGLFSRRRPELVIHLAAQAGVRHSIANPRAYVDSNIVGFLNILEGCRRGDVAHLVYASSSSVYGLNAALPLSIREPVDHPVSLYGATKKANELMAHSYSHLFGIPTTGLRFFTVYGPWGRPDMAYFKFTRAILEGTPIDIFNNGRMKRDFTYIDDIVEAVVRIVRVPALADPLWDPVKPTPELSSAPYRLYNIGSHTPIELNDFIDTLELCLNKKAIRKLNPAQPGDVLETAADVAELVRAIGFSPSTPLEFGLRRFVEWYRKYYASRVQMTG